MGRLREARAGAPYCCRLVADLLAAADRRGQSMSPSLRILANTLRALFLGALIVVIARVSSPQSETIWTVYETPGDLFRRYRVRRVRVARHPHLHFSEGR